MSIDRARLAIANHHKLGFGMTCCLLSREGEVFISLVLFFTCTVKYALFST